MIWAETTLKTRATPTRFGRDPFKKLVFNIKNKCLYNYCKCKITFNNL